MEDAEAVRDMNDSVTFRSVTPLFNFEMEEGQEFHHAGEVNSATFEVTLKNFPLGPVGFGELMKYADAQQKNALKSIHMSPEPLFGHADYFLVVDVIHSPANGLETRGNTTESVLINQAILDSLRVNASKGIDRFHTYHWREPRQPIGGTHSTRSIVTPSLFSFLGHPSVLLSSAFDSCRAVGDVLMTPWDDSSTLDRVLQMAMSYHEVTSSFHEPKHSFLLLMIIFEAMFKGQNEVTPSAVPRLAELLAQDKNERKLIIRKFRQGESNYIRTRDSIAHGDVGLHSALVEGSYPGLYKYVTKAITQLLLMRNGIIDPKQDYYEEISRVSKERFMSLGSPGA